jgi:hypothetical protein
MIISRNNTSANKHFKFILILALLVRFLPSFAQEDAEINTEIEEDTNLVMETFQSTRIINGHSVENLRKGVLEFRVEHRFGDIAGDAGGVQNMFGLDNSSDIRLALEYGITDKLMVGVGRSKGTGTPYRSLIDGFAKYRILHQKKKGMPISLSALAMSTYSYMKASEDIAEVSHFPEWQHRFAYAAQLNIARKFGERLSLSLIPTVVHRNYVPADDVNTLFAVGGALRCAITSTFAIMLEYYQPIHDDAIRSTNTNALGIAFEWITFGHNFTIYVTNSKGFGETQFIPYTYEDWLKGQFRLGFCIGRKFER